MAPSFSRKPGHYHSRQGQPTVSANRVSGTRALNASGGRPQQRPRRRGRPAGDAAAGTRPRSPRGPCVARRHRGFVGLCPCSATERGGTEGAAGRAAGALRVACPLVLRRRTAHFQHTPTAASPATLRGGPIWPAIRLFALITLLSSVLPGPASGLQSREPEVAAGRSVVSGVYAMAQAARGEAQFKQNCAACHTTAEFSSVALRRAWSGRTLTAHPHPGGQPCRTSPQRGPGITTR